MTRPVGSPVITIALPVYNGAETLAPVIEAVLGQTCSDLELLLSDNASTDGTEEICRSYARTDSRVVYHRHAENIGLLNNFGSAARRARGTYLRWIGDDDSLEPDYVSQILHAFAEDERRILVTSQIVYLDADGVETTRLDYDPVAMSSNDPVERFAEILWVMTSGFAVLDPLYAAMRRELAVLPRRNMLREDEVYAARLALAGPWGHVPAPLALRRRSEVRAPDVATLLGVPSWHTHAKDVLQSHELLRWIERSSLDPAQRRRARMEVLRLYAQRKVNAGRRGVAKLERRMGRSVRAREDGGIPHPGEAG